MHEYEHTLWASTPVKRAFASPATGVTRCNDEEQDQLSATSLVVKFHFHFGHKFRIAWLASPAALTPLTDTTPRQIHHHDQQFLSRTL